MNVNSNLLLTVGLKQSLDLADEETEDIIEGKSVQVGPNVIPCYDPATMQLLGTMPAMSDAEVSYKSLAGYANAHANPLAGPYENRQSQGCSQGW